jgi:hypothetical protein
LILEKIVVEGKLLIRLHKVMIEYYIQCDLRKQIESGFVLCDVAWIPEKFAVIGKCVKIKKDDGWDVGWVVDKIHSAFKKKESEIFDRDYLHQRKASDV